MRHGDPPFSSKGGSTPGHGSLPISAGQVTSSYRARSPQVDRATGSCRPRPDTSTAISTRPGDSTADSRTHAATNTVGRTQLNRWIMVRLHIGFLMVSRDGQRLCPANRTGPLTCYFLVAGAGFDPATSGL